MESCEAHGGGGRSGRITGARADISWLMSHLPRGPGCWNHLLGGTCGASAGPYGKRQDMCEVHWAQNLFQGPSHRSGTPSNFSGEDQREYNSFRPQFSATHSGIHPLKTELSERAY